MNIQFPAAEVVSYQVERRRLLCDKKVELTILCLMEKQCIKVGLNASYSLFDHTELHIKGQSISLADRS